MFATAQNAADALAGLWQICAGSGGTFNAPADTIGVEFGTATSDMDPIYPTLSGASGPVRGAGSDYQQTYAVLTTGPQSFQLTIFPTPNSELNRSFRYSPCPEEFQIQNFDSGDRAILVPDTASRAHR